jgi:hypothetical protein
MDSFDTGIAPCLISFSGSDHQGCHQETFWTLRGADIIDIGPQWKSF